MSRRPTCIVAACVSALCVLGTTLSAQSRFEVLSQNAMGDVPGLRIVIVRDSQLSACYTLFIMDSPAMETVAPVPTANDDATQQSVQRIREASRSVTDSSKN